MIRALVCVLCLLFAAVSAQAQTPAHAITYLTSTTAYIDAGIEEGFHSGDRVEVVRAGAVIAVLRVTDVAAHRAACAIESNTGTLVVGDSIRRAAAQPDVQASPAVSAPAEAGAPEPAAPEAVVRSNGESWARRNGLRGRIGVRYLGVYDQSGFGGDVKEPSADVRLDGSRVAGSAFDLQVDMRARHTVQTVADGREFNDGQTRVYRLNTRWRSTTDHYHLTLGRQFSSALASISTFDGAEFSREDVHWSLGAFGGTQPAPIDYGFSTDIAEYGAYLRLRTEPGAGTRYEWVTAAIGSYQNGHINREYVALLGRIMSQRFSLMLQQDVDVNRGWKRDMGESAVTLTNTFASARYRVTRAVDVDAGYDNRRNIRLYRNFVSPETQFDDTYRQGVWGGVNVGFARRYRVGFSTRTSMGGASGDANSYTATAAINRITRAAFDLRLRSTRYTNETTDGWMHTATAGYSFNARWMMDVYGGVRNEHSKLFATADSNTKWVGTDMDIDLGNSLYWNLSGERNSNNVAGYDQFYSGVSWRF
ncbi:MAG TPA: hypothetical protein VFH88_07760 [Candidatus Krumholzibacteria bacterium]|nr:hypothetical protein [Candidatus Krumholzibacteria bacterium]